MPLIFFSRRWFPLTPLLYRLLVFHALVLIAGGFWAYGKMPPGVWLQELFGSQRNLIECDGQFPQHRNRREFSAPAEPFA